MFGSGVDVARQGQRLKEAACRLYLERAVLTTCVASKPWGTKSCISATDQSGVAASCRMDGELVLDPGVRSANVFVLNKQTRVPYATRHSWEEMEQRWPL